MENMDLDGYSNLNVKLPEVRINICKQCEHSKDIIKNIINRCILCGCFIEAKARIKTATCPIGKW